MKQHEEKLVGAFCLFKICVKRQVKLLFHYFKGRKEMDIFEYVMLRNNPILSVKEDTLTFNF